MLLQRMFHFKYTLDKSPLTKDWFKDLNHKADLWQYGGPLLSWFIDNNNQNWFFYWVDVDSTYNRWMVFRVPDRTLREFRDEQISLLQIIQKTIFVYFVDIDNDLHYENIVLYKSKDIPDEYLPYDMIMPMED